MTRPFARSFDLIQKNYGWTDEQVLNLTLPRLRQVRDVIFEREAEDRRRDLRDRETELRILASYMARSKKAAKSAERITLLKRPKEAPVIASYDKAMALFGSDTSRPATVES